MGERKEEAVRESQSYERTKMQKTMVIQKLREQGCRITRQRRTILDIILEEECSCCKEIYFKVQKKDKNIGRATIYRMVNVLENIGAISRKNMYKIADCSTCCEEKSCYVKLSDDTICRLSPGMWREVMKAGMKECGYIKEQEIASIEMKACKCEA